MVEENISQEFRLRNIEETFINIKKNKEKNDKIVLLGKSKLNNVEVQGFNRFKY